MQTATTTSNTSGIVTTGGRLGSPLAAQVLAEARKLTSVRIWHGHTAAAAAFGVVGVLATLGQPSLNAARPAHEQPFMVVAALARIPLVLLGVRLAVDEYRHGTAALTQAMAEDRRHVVFARSLVAMVAGALAATVAQAGTFALASLGMASRGHTLEFDGRLPLLLAGAAVAGAAWTAIGSALGELAREPIVVTVSVAVWFLALEEVVASRLGEVGSILPGSLGYVLVLEGELSKAALAALGLLTWTAVATMAAGWVIRRRDVA